MVKFAHLDDPFFEVFNCKQAHSKEGRSLQQKEKKRGKRKSEKEFQKYKSLTWKDVGHFIFLS